MTRDFSGPEAVQQALAAVAYFADDGLATAVYLSAALGKPLLLEGEPGVGKTEVARALAVATGRELIRLQCYEGLDAAQALYEWNYPRQLLHLRASERTDTELSDIYTPEFLLERPLLRTLRLADGGVLLIDEIDRADAEFEAFLLEVLSDFQVSVPELGTIKAQHMPNVLLTSNNTRELSEALKRRCLYLHVDYPTPEVEREVVAMKVPGLPPKLAQQAVDLVQKLRTMDLKKHPSVSETIDWARALVAMNVKNLDPQIRDTTLNVLLKYETDIQKAKRALSRDDSRGRGFDDGEGGGRGGRGNGGNGDGGRGNGGRRMRDLRDPRDFDDWRN